MTVLEPDVLTRPYFNQIYRLLKKYNKPSKILSTC